MLKHDAFACDDALSKPREPISRIDLFGALFGAAPGVGFLAALGLMALGSWLSLPGR